MPRAIINNIRKLKSGHTVWRVIVRYNKDTGRLNAYCTIDRLTGRRHIGHHGSVWVGSKSLRDTIGHGRPGNRTVVAFRSCRTAARFVREVEQGLHDAEYMAPAVDRHYDTTFLMYEIDDEARDDFWDDVTTYLDADEQHNT